MKEQPEKKWFRYDTFTLNTPAVLNSSIPVHLAQDKENKLNFGTRERMVIVAMNEAGVPLAQILPPPEHSTGCSTERCKLNSILARSHKVVSQISQCQSFTTKEWQMW